jgi:hypothetical protein
LHLEKNIGLGTGALLTTVSLERRGRCFGGRQFKQLAQGKGCG